MENNKLKKSLLTKSFKKTIKEFDDFMIKECELTRNENLRSLK